jgi:hypothetical protein
MRFAAAVDDLTGFLDVPRVRVRVRSRLRVWDMVRVREGYGGNTMCAQRCVVLLYI